MKVPRKNYKVIIERDEDGFFVADIPALPGCHTQAKTMAELDKNIREVIALCAAEARRSPAYRRRVQQFSHNPSFLGVDTVTV